jgi:RND superfamily putative drug exporter
VLAWVGGTVWALIALPGISGSAASSFAALIPRHSPAVLAAKVSSQEFSFPLLAQTIVVVRNPHGLSLARQAQVVGLAARLDSHRLARFPQIIGAVPLLNTLGVLPFARERDTTALLYLYFHSGLNAVTHTQTARRLIAAELGHRPGEFDGVTGTVPAEGNQTALLDSRLKWIELATIVLVALAIGVHFRSPAAALLDVIAVAIAYVLGERAVAQLATFAAFTIPAEAQPVLVVLVFGVVTDYTIFFLSRFRALLREGEERRRAAERVIREIAPIVIAAGTTVAAGTAGLLVASLAYLRGFGPGLAVAVMVAMLAVVGFVPAALALLGRRIFWPARIRPVAAPLPAAPPRAPAPGGAAAPPGVVAAPMPAARRLRVPRVRRRLLVRLAARHPLLSTLLVLALIGAGASGLRRIAIGNGMITGLPSSSRVRQSYEQASRGFAPGVLAPAVVVVTGPGIGYEHSALVRLQGVLSRQPGVAGVLGAADQPLARPLGLALARNGTAARFAVVLRHDPLGARAIDAIVALRSRLPRLLARAGLTPARAAITGDTAISADIVSGTETSLERVIPAVLGAIFLVIAIYLRALVAPLYLVLTSLLAVAASLGLTVYVLQGLLHDRQVAYYVLFTAAVLLISLGSDYNVFVVGRIWQTARRRSLIDAIEVGGSRASRPINVAGLILAMSFGLLSLIPLRAFREISFSIGIGLLIDAFVVRTVLVPALLALFGPRSGWPGSRLKQLPGAPLPSAAPQRPQTPADADRTA